MNPVGCIGIILTVIGTIALAYGGFTYTKHLIPVLSWTLLIGIMAISIYRACKKDGHIADGCLTGVVCAVAWFIALFVCSIIRSIESQIPTSAARDPAYRPYCMWSYLELEIYG